MSSYKIFQFSFGDGYAGSAKIAILSSELLQEKGHRVILFATKNSLTEKRAVQKGIEVAALNSMQKFKNMMNEIIYYFEKEKPDFVISHHSLDRKVGFRLKKKFKSRFTNIGYRHNITKSTPIIGPLLYNKYFDYLIACSGGVGESLLKSGIKKKKVKVIYNGIDVPDNLEKISGENIKQKFGIENKIVLGLSTWFHKERKGFDILFNAYSNLDDKFILLLVGIPDNGKEEVLNYAAEFGIDKSKIIMPGYVDNIWEYYKAMDIFLLPSRSEGFSLALLEAAAAKLPIAASDIPGTNEFIIDGENGLLFNLSHPDELFEKIVQLSKDTELAEKLAKEAQQKVYTNFLIEHYAENLNNFLLQAKKTNG